MQLRYLLQALSVVVSIMAYAPGALLAASSSTTAARGKTILQDNCGRCHAVEATGPSPLEHAPPLRDIYVRHAPRELQERFSEGVASRHKGMPQIQFSDEDVHAILTYLYALAVGR
jgi:mono/diheme cytochrome c family protein